MGSMVWGIWVIHGPMVAKVIRFIATSPPAFLHGRQMVISSIGKTPLPSMLGVSNACLCALIPSTHWGFHFKLFFRTSISLMCLSIILLMCDFFPFQVWDSITLLYCDIFEVIFFFFVNSGSHHLMFYLVGLFEFSC